MWLNQWNQLKQIAVIIMIVTMSITVICCVDTAWEGSAASTYKFTRTFISGGGDITSKFSINIDGKKAIGLCHHGGPNSASSGRAVVKTVARNKECFYLAYYYGYKKNYTNGANGCNLARAFHYANIGTAYHQSAAKSKEMISTAKTWCKKNGVPDNFEVYNCKPSDGSQEFVAWTYYADGKLKLIKKSTDSETANAPGYTFKGIQYKVYESKSTDSKCYGTLTLKAGGTSNILALAPDGENSRVYYMTETKTNEYYKKKDTWYSVTIHSGQTTTKTVKDDPVVGTLSFKKEITGETDVDLSKESFQFVLTNRKNKKIIYKATSDKEGKVSFLNIPIGTYSLKENLSKEQLAEGWKSRSGTISLTIKAGQNRISAEQSSYVNEKQTGNNEIIIYKTTDDGGSVEGWNFIIKHRNSGQIYHKATDSEGMIRLDNMPSGTYEVIEEMTKSQKTRYREPETQVGKLSTNSKENLTFCFENEAIMESISLKKISEDGNVEGIEFQIIGTLFAGTDQEEKMEEPIRAVTDEKGEIDFGELSPGEYVVEETGYSNQYKNLYKLDGYANPARKFTVTGNGIVLDSEKIKSNVIEFENIPYKIQLIKTEILVDGTKTDNPVEGAEYDLYRIEEEQEVYINSYVTDESGMFVVYGVTPGCYRLYETIVPTGYIEAYETVETNDEDEKQQFRHIDLSVEDSGDSTVCIEDANRQKYGSVFIVKTDEKEEAVEDAEFALYADADCTEMAVDANGKILKSKTDTKGYLLFEKLTWGTYYIKELKSPRGYQQATNIEKVIIGKNLEDGAILTDQEVHFINERKKGTVELVKVDESETVIKTPATYSLYRDDGSLVKSELVTGEDNNGDGIKDGAGMIRVDQLEWGSYYFLEDNAPEGYEVSNKKITVTVNAMSSGTMQKKIAKDVILTSQVIATKKVLAEELWFVHGTPSFIFELAGVTVSGEKKEFHKTVTFTEEYVQNHIQEDGYVSMSALFNDVPVGDYILSEEEVSRYTLKTIEPESVINGELDGEKVIMHLSEKNAYAAATFVNEKYEWNDYSDSGILNNSINKSRSYIGLYAEYKGDALEANKPVSAFDEMLDVWAVYDDGSSKKLEDKSYRVTDIDGNSVQRTPLVAGAYTWFLEYEELGIVNGCTVDVQVAAPQKFKISFETNGGNELADMMVYKYDTLGETTNDSSRYIPVRTDYDFTGWYVDKELTQYFDLENTRITESLTLYASWKNQYENYALLLSDGTLTFAYLKESKVKKGVYENQIIEKYYSGFDTAVYLSDTDVPWHKERSKIKHIKVVDELAPTAMSYWFCNVENCSDVDFTKVDTSHCMEATNLFENMCALEWIAVGEQFQWLTNYRLPAPSIETIHYADGKWYSAASGKGYLPEQMPEKVEDVYYAFPIQKILSSLQERVDKLAMDMDLNREKIDQVAQDGYLKQSDFVHGFQSYSSVSIESKSNKGLLSKAFTETGVQKVLGIVGFYCKGTNHTYLSPYRKFANTSNRYLYYTVRNIHTNDATDIIPYVDVLYIKE